MDIILHADEVNKKTSVIRLEIPTLNDKNICFSQPKNLANSQCDHREKLATITININEDELMNPQFDIQVQKNKSIQDHELQLSLAQFLPENLNSDANLKSVYDNPKWSLVTLPGMNMPSNEESQVFTEECPNFLKNEKRSREDLKIFKMDGKKSFSGLKCRNMNNSNFPKFKSFIDNSERVQKSFLGRHL
jgi:hypothetical protein